MLRKEPQALIQRGLFFSSEFRGTSEEIANGATITGTPLSNTNKGKFIGNGSAYITYPSSVKSKIDGATALTVVIENLTLPSLLDTQIIVSTANALSGGAGIMLETGYVAGKINFWPDYSSYGGITWVTTIKHLVVVFDGTLSTNINRLKLYANGVLQTLGFSGTVPAILATGNGNLSFGAYSGSLKPIITGKSFGKISIYNVALSAQEISDLYSNSTFGSVSGK